MYIIQSYKLKNKTNGGYSIHIYDIDKTDQKKYNNVMN